MKFRILCAPIVMGMALSGCAGGPIPAPIVDMKGVSQETYNRDLADCYNQMPFLAAGNPVTKCMRAKGYKILFGY